MTRKNILVPTDFSTHANSALDFALKIASGMRVKIILLHAYHQSYIKSDLPIENISDEVAKEKRKTDRMLISMCLKIKKNKNIACEYMNEDGLVIESILETIENKKIGMVVMGTRRVDGMQDLFVNSNTSVIMERASCTVIAIPEKASFKRVKKITFVTDYRANDISCIIQIASIAKVLRSSIHILHISDGEFTLESEREFMDIFIKRVNQKIKFGLISYQIIMGGDVDEKMEEYIVQKNTDIFALSSPKHGFLFHFWRKSMVTKLTSRTKIPLITFHHENESVSFI